jgi:hypothetical protein
MSILYPGENIYLERYVSSYHSQIGSPFKPIFYPIGSLVVHEYEVTYLSLSLSLSASEPTNEGILPYLHGPSNPFSYLT